MLTITPPPAPIICSPKTWQPCQTPFTLTRITSSHSSSVTSSAGRWTQTPALLTSTSTRPSSPAICWATATTDARSPTSARKTPARTPAAVSSSTTLLLAAASRATMAMVAPASPSACAKARPRPRFPPVTTATLPSRRKLSRTVIRSDFHRVAMWSRSAGGLPAARGFPGGRGTPSPWPREQADRRCVESSGGRCADHVLVANLTTPSSPVRALPPAPPAGACMRVTDEHRAFRKLVRDVVEREIVPYVDDWERAGTFPAHELFPKLGEVGLLGLEYDPEYGGQGADHLFTVILCEELHRAGAAGIPMAIGVQTMMATPSLHEFGSDDLKRRFLEPAIRGTQVCSIAVTEAGAGSDVAGLRTRAVRDGDEWVINGSKLYIANGTQADWLCLLARTSDEGGYRGISQIIVETSTPGFSVSRKLDKLGNRSSDTAELFFEDVRVPVSNTIGQVGRGFQQQMAQFVVERMFAAYGAVGSCRRALERTRDYLKQREAFGRPLMANQYVAFRLAELSAQVDLLQSHNCACAEAYLDGEDTTRQATVAKLTAGRLLREVADTCLQFHGGMGYMEENWTARFFRDSRLASIGGGADEVMLQVLARMDGFDA